MCVWHLLRNANSNVGNCNLLPQLNRCMLEDFDVIEFEEMWAKMIIDFKLEENN